MEKKEANPLFESSYWKQMQKAHKLPQPLSAECISLLEHIVEEQGETHCKRAILNADMRGENTLH